MAAGAGVVTADEIEDAARARFVHWDPELWKTILCGPATALATRLEDSDAPVVVSYLRLVAEAVGRGYLVPAGSGAVTFLTQALTRLVPEQLPAVAGGRRAEVLAQLWNLGENLAQGPGWLERVFVRRFETAPLADLESIVRDVERQVFEAPSKRLEGPTQPRWTHLGAEDRSFLPGAMHWLAPTVLCVHDRLRTDVKGVWLAQGLWLGDGEPLRLGALRCEEDDAFVPGGGELWKEARDPRWSAPFHTTRNEFRAAASLRTSQFVVTMAP